MKELGKPEQLPLNAVFTGEAKEFTPWLSDNLDRLASVLGFELEPDETEVSVGAFKADIKARTTDGKSVVIENQFHTTDHTHLGQLLTYASGLQADIVIWIAERIREEHRSAIDWLNDKAEDADFFAVEARVLTIDGSRPAILWDVISSPNTWTRVSKKTAPSGDLSPVHRLRIEYWTALNQLIDDRGENLTRYKPDKMSWQGGTIGASDFWLNSVIGTRGRYVRVEIYLGGPDARARFNELYNQRDAIEKKLKEKLDWDPLEGKKACRISTTLKADPAERDDWSRQHAWIIDNRKAFEQVFRPLAAKAP